MERIQIYAGNATDINNPIAEKSDAMRKQRKVRIQFSTYLDPDNPLHAPMIEYLEDQSEKRNISSIICSALVEYLPHVGVALPQDKKSNDDLQQSSAAASD